MALTTMSLYSSNRRMRASWLARSLCLAAAVATFGGSISQRFAFVVGALRQDRPITRMPRGQGTHSGYPGEETMPVPALSVGVPGTQAISVNGEAVLNMGGATFQRLRDFVTNELGMSSTALERLTGFIRDEMPLGDEAAPAQRDGEEDTVDRLRRFAREELQMAGEGVQRLTHFMRQESHIADEALDILLVPNSEDGQIDAQTNIKKINGFLRKELCIGDSTVNRVSQFMQDLCTGNSNMDRVAEFLRDEVHGGEKAIGRFTEFVRDDLILKQKSA